MRDTVNLQPRNQGSIHLIQITDPHILGDPDDRFDGVDTSATLEAVIAAINDLDNPPDLVLVTGDLTHEPEPAAYERLALRLQRLGAPVFCLPGNHDDPAMMHERLNRANITTRKAITAENWRLLLLDTREAGTHGGRLSRAELDFLRDSLEQSAEDNILIALHHPPVSIASPWMDAMGLANPQDFFAVIDEYPVVRAVIWGHIHQEFRQRRGGVEMYGTPSTCVQFRPGADHYIKDKLPPGFRHLFLHSEGCLQTRIRRLHSPAG